MFVRYNRQLAAKYAMDWAESRNPQYKDYEKWGGDCTNFVSQCLHAGGIPFDHNGNNILKQVENTETKTVAGNGTVQYTDLPAYFGIMLMSFNL